MILAWHVAALQRQKTLPDLKTLLAKSGTKAAPLTLAQQKAQLVMLGDWLGRPVQPGQPKKRSHG